MIREGGKGVVLALVLCGILVAALAIESQVRRRRDRLAAVEAPQAPVVSSVEPALGRAGGGEPLTITGLNFREGDRVNVGGRTIEDDLEIKPDQIRVKRSPPGRSGETVDVAVERTDEVRTDEKGNPIVLARGVLPGSFTYEGLSRRGVIVIGFFILCIALLGGPLFVVIGGITLLGLYLEAQGSAVAGTGFFRTEALGATPEAGFGAVLLVSWLNKTTDSPLFIAIPLFTFAGTLMAESRTPERLVDLSRALIGWLPGGIALVTLVACSGFTAFTGASGVTIIALGGLLYPILRKEGYDDRFTLGLLTTCGSLGLLFPPSLPVIIYGIIAKIDIDRLFTAAIIPGLLLTVLLGLYSMRIARKERVPRHAFSKTELARAFRTAFWELPLPVLVIGGIYGGFITASEAAAVTAFYAVVAQVFIYRDVKVRDLPRVVRLSMVLVGAILVILGMALGLIDWLTVIEVPQAILNLMKTHIGDRVTFLLTINVFLLIVGCFMEGYSATLVVVPLIAPIAVEYGIDPYHLGVIFLLNLEIAYSMPPVGFNLFLSALRFGRPVVALYKAALDFVIVMAIALMIVTYVPSLSLMLFETPTIALSGAEGGELAIKAGEERVVVATVTQGGVAPEEAKRRAEEAASALADAEKTHGVRYEDLARERRRIEDALLGRPDDAAEKKEKLREVRARLAPLEAAAAADRRAKKLVADLDALLAGIEWRSRQDRTVSGRGPRFSTKGLKPGTHAVTATAVGDRGHLTQAVVTVRVAPAP